MILNSDCLEHMATMDGESVDCVVTDPPYRIIAGGMSENPDSPYGSLDHTLQGTSKPTGVLGRPKHRWVPNSELGKKWVKKDGTTPCAVSQGKMFEHNDIEFSEWLPPLYRVLKKGTHCYIMINARNLKNLQVAAEAAGFVFQNLLVWDKGNVTPNQFYMQRCEWILMLSKRPARYINNLGSYTLLSVPNPKNKFHPTEKPVGLMEFLIGNSTDKGDVVLDPFVGSGAVAIASRNLGRECVGIEIDKEYYDVTNRRLSEATQVGIF